MKTLINTLIFGTDPEFFLVETATRKPIPAHLYLGTKDKPHMVTGPKGTQVGKVFRDGYVPEANTRPHTDPTGVCKDMIRTMESFENALPAKVSIVTEASKMISPDELESAPEDVKKFGCNPSTNAYTGESSVPDVDGATHPIRYAGGHLHFSTDLESDAFPCLTDNTKHASLIKLMDWLMGVPASYIWNDPLQFLRRKNYGRAGEYRAQLYENVTIDSYETSDACMGVEYRTLPPQIWNNILLAHFFMTIGKYIINNFDELEKVYPAKKEKDIQKAINTGEGSVIMAAQLPQLPDMYNFELLSKIKQRRSTTIYSLADSYRINKEARKADACCTNSNACTQCG